MSDLTPQQRAERARRAQMAMEEFFEPAFAVVEAEYAEKMIAVAASTDPRAPEVIARLANGVKVARQIRGQIEGIIADGELASNEINRARRDEDMTSAKLRLLKIGPH